MAIVLNDSSKFKGIGPANICDNTIKLEARTQRWLLSVYKNNLISKDVYNRLRPVGSQLPKMYGLPKVHKTGVPSGIFYQ